eukprot:368568-Prorocentrum_minimum.AAC.1
MGIYRMHRPIAVPQCEYTAYNDQSQSLNGNIPHTPTNRPARTYLQSTRRCPLACRILSRAPP